MTGKTAARRRKDARIRKHLDKKRAQEVLNAFERMDYKHPDLVINGVPFAWQHTRKIFTGMTVNGKYIAFDPASSS